VLQYHGERPKEAWLSCKGLLRNAHNKASFHSQQWITSSLHSSRWHRKPYVHNSFVSTNYMIHSGLSSFKCFQCESEEDSESIEISLQSLKELISIAFSFPSLVSLPRQLDMEIYINLSVFHSDYDIHMGRQVTWVRIHF